jgi:hypothetical protein
LPVVLYDYEILSLILRGNQRLTVFENRVLSRIFGAKWDVIRGGWRKLHNDELHNFYSTYYHARERTGMHTTF